MTKSERKELEICVFGMRNLLTNTSMNDEDKEVAQSVMSRLNNLLIKKEDKK